MVKLIERSAAQDLLPLTIGTCTLCERTGLTITSLAGPKAKAALKKALKLDWPAPGRMTANKSWRCLSADHAHAFLIGADAPPDLPDARTTDQSDGWACLSLSGPGVEAVLARLIPLDLRPGHFTDDMAARTLLNHCPLLLCRAGEEFDLFVFRSMAATAVHEIGEAMTSLAARG